MLDLLYPRRCPVCTKVVRPGYSLETDKHTMPRGIGMEKLICPHCYEKLGFVTEAFCVKCGTPGTNTELCTACRHKAPEYESNRGMLYYGNPYAGKMMWDLKYNNKREYADFLGLELARRYGKRIMMNRCEAIVPVPVHSAKLRKRGYNQAELIAKSLSEYLNIPVIPELLVRDKKTVPQKELTAQGRYQNLQRAFISIPEAAQLHNVLVVDDIYTTGATMNACSYALKKCGVRKVYGITACIGRNEA